ncbi:phenylalanine N-monooxygenase [Ranunculus cassubicifolius]
MKNNTTSVPTLRWGSADLYFSTTTYSTTSLILFTSVLLFLIQFKSKILRNKAQLPPGPVPWPIIGNIPELLQNKPAFRWIENLMKQLNTDIACIRLGNTHVIPVKCPIIAREFLKKQDSVFASRPITMGTEYSSQGFLSVAVVPWGDQWKKMRRVVASELMNPARFRWLLEKRNEEADNLVRYLYNKCTSSSSGAVVNVRVVARAYSGNVIRKLMFNKRYFGRGTSDGGPGVEEEEHIDALFTVLSHLYAFCVSDYIPSLRRFDIGGHEKVVKDASMIVNRYHDSVINNKLQEWRNGDYEFKVLKKEPEDLVDVLISLKDDKGKPLLTTDEIKAQTADLVYAAVDNPSNAVEWALAEMINQPELLHKAVEEIDRVVGKDRLVQESDFSKLNYVKACARESFRLHPIAPFNLPHVSNADTTVAGYFIPKGSHVLLSRTGLGRNPNVWDEPLKFIPERHLNNGASNVELSEPELRFVSFSTGRRGCVGVQLGSAMTVMLLARLLQGFDWSAPEGESGIELSESTHDLFLAKALHAHAKPRLSPHLYPRN